MTAFMLSLHYRFILEIKGKDMKKLTWDKVKDELKVGNNTSKQIIEDAEGYVKIIASIIEKRQKLGISQRDLANLCNIPQSSVARIESFKVSPNIDTLLKLLRPLGLTLSVTSL